MSEQISQLLSPNGDSPISLFAAVAYGSVDARENAAQNVQFVLIELYPAIKAAQPTH